MIFSQDIFESKTTKSDKNEKEGGKDYVFVYA
jgi:hypothetical protein